MSAARARGEPARCCFLARRRRELGDGLTIELLVERGDRFLGGRRTLKPRSNLDVSALVP
jgi:hypothetical protein